MSSIQEDIPSDCPIVEPSTPPITPLKRQQALLMAAQSNPLLSNHLHNIGLLSNNQHIFSVLSNTTQQSDSRKNTSICSDSSSGANSPSSTHSKENLSNAEMLQQGLDSISQHSDSRNYSFHSDNNGLFSSQGLSAHQDRKQRSFIPDSNKDERYWERRRKNNEAAKRSREKRRQNDVIMEKTINQLKAENDFLRHELNELRSILKLPALEQGKLATKHKLNEESEDIHFPKISNRVKTPTLIPQQVASNIPNSGGSLDVMSLQRLLNAMIGTNYASPAPSPVTILPNGYPLPGQPNINIARSSPSNEAVQNILEVLQNRVNTPESTKSFNCLPPQKRFMQECLGRSGEDNSPSKCKIDEDIQNENQTAQAIVNAYLNSLNNSRDVPIKIDSDESKGSVKTHPQPNNIQAAFVNQSNLLNQSSIPLLNVAAKACLPTQNLDSATAALIFSPLSVLTNPGINPNNNTTLNQLATAAAICKNDSNNNPILNVMNSVQNLPQKLLLNNSNLMNCTTQPSAAINTQFPGSTASSVASNNSSQISPSIANSDSGTSQNNDLTSQEEKYRERRRRNNEAVRRCRELKRARIMQQQQHIIQQMNMKDLEVPKPKTSPSTFELQAQIQEMVRMYESKRQNSGNSLVDPTTSSSSSSTTPSEAFPGPGAGFSPCEEHNEGSPPPSSHHHKSKRRCTEPTAPNSASIPQVLL